MLSAAAAPDKRRSDAAAPRYISPSTVASQE